MVGWFLDVLVEYFFRIVVRGVRLLRSKGWPVLNVRVLSADCPDAAFGCPVTTVYYEYSLNGQKYGGI
jgi:hypothetical protein